MKILSLGIATIAVGAACLPHRTLAAGSAFAVDTAEVSEIGACKVESWASWAANGDSIATVNPACVVNLGHPVELSTQISRSRSDGEWGTALTPKARTNILPTAIGSFGFAGSVQATYDGVTGASTSIAATIPATLRLSERFRINLNGGWLWDRTTDIHYLTYGAGFDWIIHGPWTLTAEAFGQVGRTDDPNLIKTRWQAGLRFRPVDELSLDLIYGRNITGENSNWFTVAVTVRFPPRPAH